MAATSPAGAPSEPSSPSGSSAPSAPGAASGAVKSCLRTLQVLELLSSADDDFSIADMSRILGIPKSSLHGLVHTMSDRGWLAADRSGLRFRLGLKNAVVAMSFLDRDLVVSLSKTALDSLAELTGETVHLGRLDGDEIVYLAKRESTHALRLYSAVGRRLPAHATALGKAALATLPEEQVLATLPERLVPLTPNTITARDRLMEDLAETRQRGYAVDNGENTEGISCLAFALRSEAAEHSAISCSVPTVRLTPQRVTSVLEALSAAAGKIDGLLAHASRRQIE
ncbi:MAG: IclR family transcriptional regulator [Bifidobacteriaceae bacterium]|jgi:DNA-binding IclR family transcriptional regulator|nr:IclR family transcriptional regulator [Bifidobacteriaceae bacterium]